LQAAQASAPDALLPDNPRSLNCSPGLLLLRRTGLVLRALDSGLCFLQRRLPLASASGILFAFFFEALSNKNPRCRASGYTYINRYETAVFARKRCETGVFAPLLQFAEDG
jgi:hypothetical protein